MKNVEFCDWLNDSYLRRNLLHGVSYLAMRNIFSLNVSYKMKWYSSRMGIEFSGRWFSN
jgi:hypothetical protein